jgi:hypothetical protein
MEITVELIFALVTAIVTGILGAFMKNTVIPARFIPLQNLVIGIISSVIAISMGLFTSIPVAIISCLAIAMGVGGTYDLAQTSKKK